MNVGLGNDETGRGDAGPDLIIAVEAQGRGGHLRGGPLLHDPGQADQGQQREPGRRRGGSIRRSCQLMGRKRLCEPAISIFGGILPGRYAAREAKIFRRSACDDVHDVFH